ncbi:hypothetical protein AHAS_Ahas05G0038300 [Arachis hypogaea]
MASAMGRWMMIVRLRRGGWGCSVVPAVIISIPFSFSLRRFLHQIRHNAFKVCVFSFRSSAITTTTTTLKEYVSVSPPLFLLKLLLLLGTLP